jgi:hypothetical protein
MTRTKTFAEVAAKINADPASRVRIEQYKQALLDSVMVAELLDASQDEVSRIVREEDPYLSTLRAYIEDLGGELELRAIFPNRTVVLAPSPPPAQERTEDGTDPAQSGRVESRVVEVS